MSLGKIVLGQPAAAKDSMTEKNVVEIIIAAVGDDDVVGVTLLASSPLGPLRPPCSEK